MSRPFHVVVRSLPKWLEWKRLLGPGPWTIRADDSLALEADLSREAAADLAARLRGVGIGGKLIKLEIRPALNRKELRKASTEEARRYRKGSPGFTQRGTRLDREGKFSLSPEAIALQLGKQAKGMRVVDAFAGAGGNAIGFARAGCRVTAIELNEQRLAMARHNAAVYDVSDRIEFIAGDARTHVPELDADLLFLDPPWGEDYNKERMALDDLQPCREVLDAAAHIPSQWIKTPPSFDPSTLPGFQPEAIFGVGAGDDRRVKFLLLRIP